MGGSRTRNWIYSFSPLHDDGGGVAGIFVTALDTTDKVAAERRLTEVQEHQRQMLRQMPGFVGMMTGPDLVYTYVNDAYVAISERTDFVGRRFRDVFADIEGQGFFEAFEGAFRTGKGIVTRGMELRLHGREDAQYVDFVLEPIRDEAGAVTGLFVGGYETTEVYRTNESLERQVADRTVELRRFRDIVDATASPICAFDTSHRLIAFNKAHNDEFRRVNGFDTKLGDVFPDLFVPEQQPVMRALMDRALTGERFNGREGVRPPGARRARLGDQLHAAPRR